MKPWVRQIRATMGMGLTWSAAWFVAGILLARVPGLSSDLPFALLFAPLGFVTGILFSGILAGHADHRRFDSLSLSRLAAWGGTSGLLLSALFVAAAVLRGVSPIMEFLTFGPALAIAGAACSAGSLALARRAGRAKELAEAERHLIGPDSEE